MVLFQECQWESQHLRGSISLRWPGDHSDLVLTCVGQQKIVSYSLCLSSFMIIVQNVVLVSQNNLKSYAYTSQKTAPPCQWCSAVAERYWVKKCWELCLQGIAINEKWIIWESAKVNFQKPFDPEELTPAVLVIALLPGWGDTFSDLWHGQWQQSKLGHALMPHSAWRA